MTKLLPIAISLFAAACSGGGGLSGSTGSNAKKAPAAAPASAGGASSGSDSFAPAAGTPTGDDAAIEAAVPAASVSGAFLTCGPAADAGDTGTDSPFGCVFRDGKTRLKLKQAPSSPLGSIKSHAGKSTPLSMKAAPAGSPWHFHFAVPPAVLADAASVTVSATVGGTSVSKMTERLDEAPDGAGEATVAPVEQSPGASGPAIDIPKHKYLFVTTTAYTGAEIGGLAGANEKCNTAGNATGIQRTWRAYMWIDNGEQIVEVSSDSGDGLYNLHNDMLAKDVNAPENGFLASVYDDKVQVAGATSVWTGVPPGVSSSNENCDNFGSAHGQGVTGVVNDKSGSAWYEDSSAQCSSSLPIYCISL